ncbi:MAG: hypothetical protein IT204_15850 [Fimbriimonadaceae bacterium]|nr:hypothetical protein [Fimbriimonadaceae bacterium]
MYDLKPRGLFAHRRLFEVPAAVRRMERMLAAMGKSPADVTVIDHTDMAQVAEVANATDAIATDDIVRGGHGRFRQGRDRRDEDPVLVFNTFEWDPDRRARPEQRFKHPMAQRTYRLLCGQGEDFLFSKRGLDSEIVPGSRSYVCQGGWGVHTLCGCVHRCDYCGDGHIVTLQCDLERVADVLTRTFAERPQQKLYRWDMYSDSICFEPEYGGTAVLGDCFNRSPDQLLLLYTKSDNFDHLLEFDYQRHVLSNWTVAMDTVTRQIERNTPPLVDRLRSMRRVAEAGYTVRAGFTPIIPIRDWRRETTEAIELMFSIVDPEVVRLWVVSMMELDEIEAMFGDERLDPWCLQRAREAAAEMRGAHHAPFPLDVRCAIYEWYLDELRRVSPRTPVNLCTEQPQAWERLQPKLQMPPNQMFCCCGGTSRIDGWRGPLAMGCPT